MTLRIVSEFKNDDQHNGLRLRSHQDCDTLTALVYDYFSTKRDLGRTQKYPKGAAIWDQGVGDHYIHILQRGQVLITLNDVEGSEVILRVIKPGELFGELCFCSKREQLRENCARAAIDSESLRRLEHRVPTIGHLSLQRRAAHPAAGVVIDSFCH